MSIIESLHTIGAFIGKRYIARLPSSKTRSVTACGTSSSGGRPPAAR